MFERFTDRARRVLVLAQEEARLLEHNYIGTEHVLLGLVGEGEGVGAIALEQLGVDLEKARDRVLEATKDGPQSGITTGSPPFTPRCKKCLELALREALQLGHNYIGTEHMLLGIIREGDGIGAQILVEDFGLALSEVRQEVIQLLSGYAGRAQKVEPAPRVVKATFSEQQAFDLINWIDAFDTINVLPGGHPLRMLRDKLT